MEIIKAAVLTHPKQPLELQDVHIDVPLPGEIRVKTLAVGLCHSDLHYLQGNMPIDLPAVLGHEVVGEVEKIGDGINTFKIGDRVVITIAPSCGMCPQCGAGLATLCSRPDIFRNRPRPKLLDANGNPLNLLGSIGAFSELFIVPEQAAVKISEKITPAEACLLGCCVATGFGAVVHKAAVTALDTVAVIGCGGVGIAAIQSAKIAGARKIVAIDLYEQKLQQAKLFGATHTALSDAELPRKIEEISPGGVDKSFEAVGSPVTASIAFNMLATDGTATILGLQPEGNQIQIDAVKLIEGDRKITGAYMGANQLSKDILAFEDHYQSGNLMLSEMVTSRWKFSEINEGFEAMLDPQTIRAVVEF